MIWLLQIPPLIVGTLTVIVVVALSLLGLFIFHRLVSR
jgi:thiol:disulfide interchange protein